MVVWCRGTYLDVHWEREKDAIKLNEVSVKMNEVSVKMNKVSVKGHFWRQKKNKENSESDTNLSSSFRILKYVGENAV